MLAYILRRIFLMIPTLLIISIISFAIIQLPPGDYLTTLEANLAQTGEQVDQAQLEALRVRYGLDRPVYVQYGMWIAGILHGDLGQSFAYNKPVTTLIGQRLALTMTIAVLTILLTWVIALPIGIYSATHQYSFFDYLLTLIGFIGMATPPFLLALVLLYFSYAYFGTSVGGLYSDAFADAPWTVARFIDLLKHIWVPIVILATGGSAALIRGIRANLLDQLQMPYVVTARAKGLPEWRLLLKYPVRLAINPMVSTIGWMLPFIVSGSLIVDVVLSLPTIGPLLYNALMAQDMFLAGSIVMILSSLTVIGTL
ncbi:MAG: ABC transporter permease, partial [Candidatus Hydrogenedentes bacterium]|nr:ABC transporter permease [Candidatus Hydrogenedentota bacterium]